MSFSIRESTRFKAQRRAALSRHSNQCGIDYIEVEPLQDGWNLQVYFVPGVERQKQLIPPGIMPAQIEISRLGAASPLRVQSVTYPHRGESRLTVQVRRVDIIEEDFSAYRLTLKHVPGLDRFFDHATFFLHPESAIDPRRLQDHPVIQPAVEIDYLAKDYASFRQVILDHLALLTPQWQERHEADLGIVLVDLMAYAADYLSYYQDAVATEAYLGTARRRTSVRRHARLLDYRMHEGCNARVWVQVQVDDEGVPLKAGTPLVTRKPNLDRQPQSNRQGSIFETMHEAVLYQTHNSISFYTWGATEIALESGATTATLAGHFPHLQAGDVLIFEEVLSPVTGQAEDANPQHRHSVRLIEPPTLTTDRLENQPITEIRWAIADALPFPLWVATYTIDGEACQDISVALGNIVLADAGNTIHAEPLPVVTSGYYLPQLRLTPLTYRVPFDCELAKKQAAKTALVQHLDRAMPVISLTVSDREGQWTVQSDLLGSDRFAREFVVETESDGSSTLRFGNDRLGRRPSPGTRFIATYRVGNGAKGNIGPETICHAVTLDERITGVRNPLAAGGGRDPESLEQVRLNAPQAFKTQHCVTDADYAAAAKQHPEVRQAIAQLGWTGSWHTTFIRVSRYGGQAIDAAFQQELKDFLEPMRLAGADLEIAAPQFVPMEIALTVYVKPHHCRSTVRQALLETFSDRDLAGGRRGFFHPDSFGFGQPVYLSPIVAIAMQIDGVLQVNTERFQRWGNPPQGELAAGKLEIQTLAIARLSNDPRTPQNGTICFHLVGGV